ncbi:MAG: SAM-dependent chlorinase/fluorinase [Vicingaceae bacterium]
MPIITLTTDLGLRDYYVGSLKGALLSQYPEATIVDISHEIKPFDMLQASIVVRNAFPDFPEGSIHLIGVNPDATEESKHLVVKVKGQFFIMPDNGMYSLIFDQKPDEVVSLDLTHHTEMMSFPAKDIYITAACHIARGGSLNVIGKPLKELTERMLFRAVIEERLIRGMALYIDHYGNVLTNIDRNIFKQFSKYPSFSIQLRRTEYEIREISNTYGDVPHGEKLAMFSSSGLLEISINQGNASRLLGINQNDVIRIEFYDH